MKLMRQQYKINENTIEHQQRDQLFQECGIKKRKLQIEYLERQIKR